MGAMTRRASLLTALVATVGLLGTACSTSAPQSGTGYQVTRMTSSTGQAELLLRPDRAVSGLVLFMHGFAANEKQVIGDSSLFPVRDALLAAGYAIASSNSHGNNVGNPESVQDQQNLLRDARARLGTTPTVDILAVSMGGVDALLAAATHAIPGLRSVALLSPVTNTSAYLNTGYRDAISAAFGHPAASDLEDIVARNNPMLLPARDFVDYQYGFWRSTQDKVVPSNQSDEMAGRLVRAGASVTLSRLSGDHGNFSTLQPAQVVELFTSRGSR
ncbi:MAG: hypothetical protein DLM58_10720 [Pseudonocardiales bacterium]|nr:MAG: hypothetical protein DLM58_10720 [Pseudonocardiales bacterium]